MIPLKEKTVEVTSNIAGETGQFGIDQEAMAHVMEVLSNLYSDPESAIVREYSTNAYDAQIEAGMVPGGIWKPIEVSTPSAFQKSYVIRDFGVGMDAEDLRSIYSRYGKSTKTDSNDVVGMLGMGSKSALTYTNSFTVTGIKNGVKTKAIISKNDENIPVFHIVHEAKTDEPSGVEVNIPVKHSGDFANKAVNFFQWWAPGLVLINGNPNKTHGKPKVHEASIAYKVNGKAQYAKAEVYLNESGMAWRPAQSYVIMGNVPYLVEEAHVPDDLTRNGLGFIAYVPIGAVNFPPSRETLYYNENTRSVISSISTGLFEAVAKQKADEILKADTYLEAWKQFYNTSSSFLNSRAFNNLTYRGEKFQQTFTLDYMDLTWNYDGHGRISEYNRIGINHFTHGDVIIITGTTVEKPTSYFKKKVKHYMVNQGLNPSRALLVDDDPDIIWLSEIPRVHYDDIKAIKLPKTPAQQNRAEATYEYKYKAFDKDGELRVLNGDDTKIDLKALGKKRLCYISPSDIRATYRQQGCSAYQLMQTLPEDVVLVVLAKNREAKFLRNHKKAMHVTHIFQKRIDDLVAQANGLDVNLDTLDYGVKKFLKRVEPSFMDDPDLITIAKAVQHQKDDSPHAKAMRLSEWGRRYARIETTVPDAKIHEFNPEDRYPLLRYVGTAGEVDHVTTYCNAVYANLVRNNEV